MEGQAGVHDGSEGETGFGYWLCNITAVNDDASTVMPAYKVRKLTFDRGVLPVQLPESEKLLRLIVTKKRNV